MKKLLTALLAVLAMTACEQEVYDKGDGAYSYLRADFVEAAMGRDSLVTQVLTDDNERLTLLTPYRATWMLKADTAYRAVLYYNNRGERVEAVSLSRVSTMVARPASTFKGGVKTDPINLEAVWLSGTKKYLNLSVVMKTGTMADGGDVQTLGVAGDTIVVGDDGLRTYHLRLYHSQGDVPQYYSQRAYFSVPVSGMEADSLRLTVNTYDGVVTRGFRL